MYFVYNSDLFIEEDVAGTGYLVTKSRRRLVDKIVSIKGSVSLDF
jgi:hypothetical protein